MCKSVRKREGGGGVQTVALILSKLLPPHTLTSSHPHHLTRSSPIAHPVSLTASHVHNVPLPPSLHNLPPLTPSPLTPSHHPPPCTPSHCTHAHEQPRYLNRSKMESTVPSCVTCPVEALLHVRSIGYRLPGRIVITTNTPNATATTVRARGCEVVQHGLYYRASPPLWSRAHRSSGSGLATRRSLSVTPLASNDFSVSSVAACLLCTGSGYSFDFAQHFRASLSEL